MRNVELVHVTESDLETITETHCKVWPGQRSFLDCDSVMQLVREIRRLRSIAEGGDGKT